MHNFIVVIDALFTSPCFLSLIILQLGNFALTVSKIFDFEKSMTKMADFFSILIHL